MSAYFRRAAEDDFLRDTIMDNRLYLGLLDYAIDEEITDIEALCLIRFFAEKRDLRSDKLLTPYIRDLAERDIIFDFFREYRDIIPMLGLFDGDVFIEYRGRAGAKVELNYVIEQSGNDEADYRVETMREVFPGVYQMRVLVFPGEIIQYYITEYRGGTAKPIRSGVVRSEERLLEGHGRYEILQDAMVSYGMGDIDSFMELTGDYLTKDKLVREVLWAE